MRNPSSGFPILGLVLPLCGLLICFVGSISTASAQAAGEIIWSVDLTYTPSTAAPRVAPDGNIYLHSEDLYKISPVGQILWSKDSGDSKPVDIGPDGTVYSGSGLTIFAYTPAGQLIWSFTEPPGGQGIMAGPTVGADGNIYAVTDGGGLGALALNPAGSLLWNVPGYSNNDGTGIKPVPLAPDRLYFAEEFVPGCTDFAEGLNAVDLDGNLLWCVSFSGVARPVASPNGDALMNDTGTLYDYNPDGSREWSFQFPFPSGTLLGLTTGPDANIYIFHSYVNLWSLTPTGKKRWQVDGIAGGTFPVMPTVSPDGSVLVFPTVYSFGVNGKVVAVNSADGAVLWTLPITGPSAGASGPVAFSNDGATVYVPVTEIGGVNKLLAVAVNGGAGGVPPAPTNLAARVQSKTIGGSVKSRVKLSWTDNATNESGYAVERCSGGGCTNFSPLATVAANTVSYFDKNVSAGTTYRYRVAATSTAGQSPYSNIAEATTP